MRYALIIYKRDVILTAMKQLEGFWKCNFNDKRTRKLLQYRANTANFFVVLVFLAITAFVMKPFLLKGTTAFYVYIPPQIPYSWICLIEVYVILVVASAAGAFNALMVSLITVTVVQFRQINIMIERLNVEDIKNTEDMRICREAIGRIVNHHNFLLGYITSADLLRIAATSVDLLAECVIVYGIPAQSLMDEAGDIQNSVYCRCCWYEAPIPIRKSLMLLMVRAQRDVNISAAGLIIMNKGTVLMILRSAYSFYTFLQTMS